MDCLPENLADIGKKSTISLTTWTIGWKEAGLLHIPRARMPHTAGRVFMKLGRT